jgi:hypothetical protein
VRVSGALEGGGRGVVVAAAKRVREVVEHARDFLEQRFGAGTEVVQGVCGEDQEADCERGGAADDHVEGACGGCVDRGLADGEDQQRGDGALGGE